MRKSRGYWNLERLKEAAAPYSFRKEFRKNNCAAYTACERQGLLDICCSHMERLRKPDGYWTLEKLKMVAALYLSRKEFRKNNHAAYITCEKAGLMDVCCSHMKRLGNLTKRCIYAFEWSNNYAYIGLTYNVERRYSDHIKEGPVCNHIKDFFHVGFKFTVLSDYMDQECAARLEAETIKTYEQNGWILLNKAKAGSLGSSHRKWTKEKCAEKALEYKTKNKFKREAPGAHSSAKKNGFLEEITSHMPENVSVKWDTIEKVEVISSKYKSRWEFQRKARGAYLSAWKNKWLDTLFPKTKTNNNKE